VQSAPHDRTCVPQLPHAPPISVSPGVHEPIPVHAPSFVQAPPLQI
jgi:hypothetical protein